MAATKASIGLQALTLAALALPGLLPAPVIAAEEDEVDLQYTHYQEGQRNISILTSNLNPSGGQSRYQVPSLPAIEADTIRGRAKMSLSDRVKFAFNYTQDTWSGATPISTMPEVSSGNVLHTSSHASPYVASVGTIYMDQQLRPLTYSSFDNTAQIPINPQVDTRLVHTMSYASPEVRKQGDFKLRYEGDNAAIAAGGGLSIENDYESRFVNLDGQLDFNRKLTSLSGGLSYTNSATRATLDPKATHYIMHTDRYNLISPKSGMEILTGNREDWAGNLNLTQVLSKNAVVELGMSYTRSRGFMANPYKLVSALWVTPVPALDTNGDQIVDANGDPVNVAGLWSASGHSYIEQRPELRNQFNWNARYVQYVEAMDAGLHLGYQFFHDDWGINAHTFEADWGQPLGGGWTLTPRVRYYSQSAANFYHPYVLSFDLFSDPVKATDNFSSDQRLSAYGALSGGITLSKQFAKGVTLETGFEYYSHKGSLKLGGGGEGAYADFNYYMANAAIKLNLETLSRGLDMDFGGHGTHRNHHHGHAPAGVMFDHMLAEAGDVMVGYRYMYSLQNGGMLHGTSAASNADLLRLACPSYGINCEMLPTEMSMHMHMLDLMYAPTDWLNLMLMPQFVDMGMSMDMAPGVTSQMQGMHMGMAYSQADGGIGDTGLYALTKLLDVGGQHVHLTLGVSAPTGNIAVPNQLRWVDPSATTTALQSYGMQLGSGTWDFKPSLTYTGEWEDWFWGGQLSGTKRLQDKNTSGYALGDMLQTTAWSGYQFTHWLSGTVRGVYTTQNTVRHPPGQTNYTFILTNHPDSTGENSNYGGHYGDVGFGLNVVIPGGSFAGHRLGVEWLQPVYTNVNGYQLDRNFTLSATWSMGF